ncbi:hypothetical protein IV55_GL000351 [Furfurilactobacillus siliginis]|uniref:Integral membrane protein n=3 Tax=Furfurilactobacillus siliginis TaxID=348151 RepID=A0A0R2L092_9LACO|nr:hypothetical protein IV55_GL000351 [Furfurilactobacillus siliginis]
MTGYFASRHMAPFGNSSLLTVDMGQQYIDFFAFFRDTVLHHPGSFFYSFGKGLGGETTSLWAYYLMSPFNLLLLPFGKGSLSVAVLIITVLKYGCAGLSFAWVLRRLHLQNGWRLPILATAYALNGWVIANQLNLMWLDVLITLPLVIYGLELLIQEKRWLPYVSWLSATLIINYYMGYMVCLFIVLYTCFSLAWHWQSAKQIAWAGFHIGMGSILAAGVAAVILVPTYTALQLSKATYTLTKINWRFDYMPAKMLGKLFPGSFNFAQMPKGQPNIFIGTLVLLLVVAFFMNRTIKWPVKTAATLITLFLLLSVCFTPLNLLWHAGQFPIWYPYRFSFVLCFWFIWLAAIGWQSDTLSFWTIGVTTAITAGIAIYLGFTMHSVNFLTLGQLLTGVGFMLGALLLCAPIRQLDAWRLPLLLLLTIADLGTNAVLSLNKISYVPQADFQIYTNVLKRASNETKQHDHGFYRIGTTFQRTKGDPLQGDYFGASHFGSTLERKTTGFYDLTGNPDGDGFITYANGTQFMDAFLNMKYFWNVNNIATVGHKSQAKYLPVLTRKPDLTNYPAAKVLPQTTTHHNDNALGMGFMAASSTLAVKELIRDPMSNQNQLWNGLLGQPAGQRLFSAVNFSGVTMNNTNQITNITGSTLTRQRKNKPASMSLRFTPPTDDAYYLSLGANMQKDNVTILLNGQPLTQYPTFRNTVLVNLTNQQKDQPQTITFKLKKSALWLQNVTLYKMPQATFNSGIQKLQQHPLNITDYGQTHLTGHITATRQQPVLMTTIPAQPGWQAMVDGQPARLHTVADEFIAVSLKPGAHRVSFSYHTPKLWLGIIISLGSIVLTAIIAFWQRHQR